MGDVVVHRADDTVFEEGVAAAEDEINVTCDLAVGVVLGGRFAGRKTARAEKAILLPLLFGQRGAEERVLTAQQLYAACPAFAPGPASFSIVMSSTQSVSPLKKAV